MSGSVPARDSGVQRAAARPTPRRRGPARRAPCEARSHRRAYVSKDHPPLRAEARFARLTRVKDIRVALVGYGMAGREFHAPLLREVDGLRVTHVVTGDAERAAGGPGREPRRPRRGDVDELWADADQLDLVVSRRRRGARRPRPATRFAASCAVVVDKPLATTAADAAGELTALAAARGVLLTVFQNRRWDPEHLTARAVLASGALGEVIRYEARYERWRPVPKTRWRGADHERDGGGLLMDLQPHLVDGALDLFGPAASVYAELGALTTVGDDVTFLALRHVSGVTSHLGATSLAGAPGPATRLLGPRGDLPGRRRRRRPHGVRAWRDADDEHRGWLVRGDEAEPVRAGRRRVGRLLPRRARVARSRARRRRSTRRRPSPCSRCSTRRGSRLVTAWSSSSVPTSAEPSAPGSSRGSMPGLDGGAVGAALDDVGRGARSVGDRLDELGAVVDEPDPVVGGVARSAASRRRPAGAAAGGAAPRCRSARRCRRAAARGR